VKKQSKSSKHAWIDPDDGPALTASMMKRAEIAVGGKVVWPATGVLVNDRCGCPRMVNPKQAVK
jgi:hypothetical protein